MFKFWVKDGDGDYEILTVVLIPREDDVECYFGQWESEGGVFTDVFTILHLIAIKRFLESKGAGEGIKLNPISRCFNNEAIQ